MGGLERNKMRRVIAVDLGGTNLRVSLVKGNKIFKYIKVKTPKTQKELVEKLSNKIKELMCFGIKGIGVSSAGPLLNGVIKNPPNLPIKNFDLENYLRKKFKKKVVIENDANCAALAEAKYGCKKKNFVLLTLGTGVGGGVILNKKLYTGEGYASEPGHLILDNGKDLEHLWQLQRKESKKCFGKVLLVKEMLEKGGKDCNKILNQTSDYLGQGIGSLINIFDPEVVVLAGGVREAGSVFLNRIKKSTKRYILIPRNTPIIWSKIDHPGTVGAGLLI